MMETAKPMEAGATRPVLPPGTLLQHMYLRERLRDRPAGTFVEVGVGSGHMSRLLLDLGWSGVSNGRYRGPGTRGEGDAMRVHVDSLP